MIQQFKHAQQKYFAVLRKHFYFEVLYSVFLNGDNLFDGNIIILFMIEDMFSFKQLRSLEVAKLFEIRR